MTFLRKFSELLIGLIMSAFGLIVTGLISFFLVAVMLGIPLIIMLAIGVLFRWGANAS